MNDARQLYLASYFRIDALDHMIKNCKMFYRSFKYWHSPMLHAKAMAVVIAYDIYQECAEGNLDESWKVDKPLSFWHFREKLSEQMLKYRPVDRKYPGDSNLRCATSQNMGKRKNQNMRDSDGPAPATHGHRDEEIAPSGLSGSEMFVYKHLKQYVDKLTPSNTRYCGDLRELERHVAAAATGFKDGRRCAFCGELTYSKCVICDAPLCFFPLKGKNRGKLCYLHYHDITDFGLGYSNF